MLVNRKVIPNGEEFRSDNWRAVPTIKDCLQQAIFGVRYVFEHSTSNATNPMPWESPN